MKKLGFIGMGNMAQALCLGFANSGLLAEGSLYAFAPNQEKLIKNSTIYKFQPIDSVEKLVELCDVVIMACKPYQIESVLAKVGKLLSGKALVSVAAGWGFADYAKFLDETVRVQFVMPNTPAMVGEGVHLFEKTNSLEKQEREEIQALFASTGTVIELPDHLMGIGGAITGCGPAFVDLFMEAYGDAAVKYGIPRQDAYKMIAQTVLGSAKLQAVTGEHPGVLKDNVCSPAGTTIRGVGALEKAGFRSACISSIDAIMEFKKEK